MNMKKLIAAGLAVLMLSGCGMPKIDFDGAESPLFVKDESGAAASGKDAVTESSLKAESGTSADSAADSKALTGNSKTDSAAVNSVTGRTGRKTESASGKTGTESALTESGVAAGSTKDDTAYGDVPTQLAVERMTAYDFEYDEKNDVMYLSSDIQYLTLGENDAKAYARLATRLETLSDDTLAAGEDAFADLLAKAEDAYADDEGDFTSYELSVSAVPVRTDSHIFSYFERTEVKGDTDSVQIAAHTIDTETGRELTLSKVLTDTSSLPEILAKRQKESYPDISEDLFADRLGEYKDTDYVWTLGYDGITFYFEEEDEILALTILRDEEKKLFTKAGEPVPENYAVGLAMSQAFVFDADGDGRQDVLTIEGRENANGDFDGVNVTLNNKKKTAHFVCNTMLPTYIHTVDGDYIYLFCTEDGDYQQLNIFSFEDGSPSYSGYMDNVGRSYRSAEGDDLACEVLLTDPEDFSLDSRMDLLSSYGAGRSYYVGENGMPESDDTYYYVTGERVLTSSEAMKVNIVNERGRVTKKNQTIKAGTKWTLYRTDGERVVDFILSDDRIARVELDSAKWPQTIGGEDVTDLFEGVMYAG